MNKEELNYQKEKSKSFELITTIRKDPFYNIITTQYSVKFINDQDEIKRYWITEEQYNDLLKEL